MTLIAKLWQYVLEHQWDWDIYFLQLTYSYDTHIYQSTNLTPLSLVPSRHPHGSTTFNNSMAILSDIPVITHSHTLRAILLHWMMTMRQDAVKGMKLAQRRYKDNHDRNVGNSPPSLNSETYVYIYGLPLTTSSAERLATESYKNLMPPKLVPFRII